MQLAVCALKHKTANANVASASLVNECTETLNDFLRVAAVQSIGKFRRKRKTGNWRRKLKHVQAPDLDQRIRLSESQCEISRSDHQSAIALHYDRQTLDHLRAIWLCGTKRCRSLKNQRRKLRHSLAWQSIID